MLARTCPSPSVKCGDFAELYVFNHLQTWKPLLILGRSFNRADGFSLTCPSQKLKKLPVFPEHLTVFLPCQNYQLARFATNYTKIYYPSEVQMCLKR